MLKTAKNALIKTSAYNMSIIIHKLWRLRVVSAENSFLANVYSISASHVKKFSFYDFHIYSNIIQYIRVLTFLDEPFNFTARPAVEGVPVVTYGRVLERLGLVFLDGHTSLVI